MAFPYLNYPELTTVPCSNSTFNYPVLILYLTMVAGSSRVGAMPNKKNVNDLILITAVDTSGTDLILITAVDISGTDLILITAVDTSGTDLILITLSIYLGLTLY
jgi:hypothetical protein